jgi:hypothetical protein
MAHLRALLCVWLVGCGGIAVVDGDDGQTSSVVEPFRCPSGDPVVPSCATPTCWCGHGSCGCELSCGSETLVAECAPDAEGARMCNCIVNDQTVASCVSLGGADCDLSRSCCAELLGL